MRRSAATVIAVLALIVLPLTASSAAADSADSVIHVSASAGQGGDGSADKPYATLTEAIAAAPAGATIEVGDGTYREGEITVDKGLTIRAAEGADLPSQLLSNKNRERCRCDPCVGASSCVTHLSTKHNGKKRTI